MLNAITVGSLASSPMSLSAGGQDEQPCEVKSSTTARGSAIAGGTTATTAQMLKALDQKAPDRRETGYMATIAVNLVTALAAGTFGVLRVLCVSDRRKRPLS